MSQLLHASNMSLSFRIISHWLAVWMLLPAKQRLTRADGWSVGAAELWQNLHYIHHCVPKHEKKYLQGVRRETLCPAVTSKWHFLFIERNVDAALSSAALLTVWKVAREEWWQADGLSMVSAPCNLLTHTTKYQTCFCDFQFTPYLPKIARLEDTSLALKKSSSSGLHHHSAWGIKLRWNWKSAPGEISITTTRHWWHTSTFLSGLSYTQACSFV